MKTPQEIATAELGKEPTNAEEQALWQRIVDSITAVRATDPEPRLKTPAAIAQEATTHFAIALSDTPEHYEPIIADAIARDRAQLRAAIEKMRPTDKPGRHMDDHDWENQGRDEAIDDIIYLLETGA